MLPKSLIIIRNRPSKGIYVCPESEFQNLLFLVLRTEAMSVSGFHYCICAFILCRCSSFKPSFGPLSPFLLHYVAVSRPCFACRNLAQQDLKKVVKTSVINGDLLEGGAIQNTTVVWASSV